MKYRERRALPEAGISSMRSWCFIPYGIPLFTLFLSAGRGAKSILWKWGYVTRMAELWVAARVLGIRLRVFGQYLALVSKPFRRPRDTRGSYEAAPMKS
jgi:hypothetical protein